jgi:hypothetical protein
MKYMSSIINISDRSNCVLERGKKLRGAYQRYAVFRGQWRVGDGRRGLDPNVWFQSVEYIAAEKIGQETVTYVSKIYKYYVAYRLILESRAATKEAVEKLKRGAK